MEISIELVDDVAFHRDGTAIQLLQAKHTLSSTATLTDASSEIWKTLRVWITQVSNNEVQLDGSILTLVTSAQAQEDSAAAKLRPEDSRQRDVDGALTLLTQAATSSRRNADSAEGKAVAAFLALGVDERRALVSKIQVLDASPNIIDARSEILKLLRVSTNPESLDAVYERIEGWWFDLVIRHLSQESPSLIPYHALLAKINDVQVQFFQDNLPIDFLEAIAPQEEDLSSAERTFIEQLKLVMVSEPRIQKAINDYYRAFQQRSQWIREDLVNISELDQYEDRLVDEWERLHLIMKENLPANANEPGLAEAGRNLYNLIDQKLELTIRPRVTQPYVMRGSFHILSNKLRVGWHADFLNRLSHLLSTPAGGTT